MAKEGLMLRDKLEESEATAEGLRENVAGMSASLEQAQANIKMLNTKLAACRSAEAIATAANFKSHGTSRRMGLLQCDRPTPKMFSDRPRRSFTVISRA